MTTTTTTADQANTTPAVAGAPSRAENARTAAQLAVAIARVAVALEGIPSGSMTCAELDTLACVYVAAGHFDAAAALVRTHMAIDLDAHEGCEDDWHTPGSDEDHDAWADQYVHCLGGYTLASAVDELASGDLPRWMVEGSIAEQLTCARVRAVAAMLAVGGHRELAENVWHCHRQCCDTGGHGDDEATVRACVRAVARAAGL